MAFDLTACPSGWSEYTAARGRFLRGIDNGAGNDPAGTRAPGNMQADAVQDHTHYLTGDGGGADDIVAFKDSNLDGSRAVEQPGMDGFPRGDSYVYVGQVKTGRKADETRPKNVAVLYCRKD